MDRQRCPFPCFCLCALLLKGGPWLCVGRCRSCLASAFCCRCANSQPWECWGGAAGVLPACGCSSTSSQPEPHQLLLVHQAPPAGTWSLALGRGSSLLMKSRSSWIRGLGAKLMTNDLCGLQALRLLQGSWPPL